MECRPCVAFLAHWADHNQVSFTGLDIWGGWVDHFVIRAELLPLLYTPLTVYVLALFTLLRLDDYHLADTTDEMLIEFGSLRSCFCVAIIRDNAAERSRVNLHWDILCHWLATSHDLLDLFVLQNEKAICVLLAVLWKSSRADGKVIGVCLRRRCRLDHFLNFLTIKLIIN